MGRMDSGSAVGREVRPLVSLAVPIVIGLAATTLVSATDTVMIAPLGTTPLAAVALTTSAALPFVAALYGLLSVVGVKVAQSFGARQPKAIAGQIRAGLAVGLGASLAAVAVLTGLLFLLPWLGQPAAVLEIVTPYWLSMSILLVPFALLVVFKQFYDAIGRPWLGVAFAFLAVVANVPLNLLLIYGAFGLPGLGLLGSGIASVLSETIALAAAYLYWRRAKPVRRMRVRVPVTRSHVGRTVLDGLPLGIAYIGETGAFAVAGLMLGWLGATALAANQVVMTLADIVYMLPLGLAAAVAIRIGQAEGAGEKARLRPIAVAALAVVVGWMGLVTLAIVLGGRSYAALLSDDPAVVAIAASIFVVVAVMQIADGVQSTALGALRGLMDTTWPSVMSLIVYWLVALPASYIAAFVLDWGPAGIWAGFASGLTIAAIALVVRLARMTRAGAPRPRTGDHPAGG